MSRKRISNPLHDHTAVHRTGYTFQSGNLIALVQPLLKDIKQGDYRHLHEMAWQMFVDKPSVRDFLFNVNLPCVPEEFKHALDEDSSLDFWLAVLMGSCVLESVPLYSHWMALPYLDDMLPLAGWTQDEIREFVFGESLCTLLDLSEMERSWPMGLHPWCEMVSFGWLSLAAVKRCGTKFTESERLLPQMLSLPAVKSRNAALYAKVGDPWQDIAHDMWKHTKSALMRVISSGRDLLISVD